METKIVLIMMIGMPCSGKTTWINENLPKLKAKYNLPTIVISRDDIREELHNGIYKYDSKLEEKVTKIFYERLSKAVAMENVIIILDNTHVLRKYIDAHLISFKKLIESGKMEFYLKPISVPKYKAYMRNVLRRTRTGKWIPLDILESFYEKFKTLDLKPYEKYLYNE